MASATGAAPPATGTWVITIIAAIFYGSFSVVPSLQKKAVLPAAARYFTFCVGYFGPAGPK
jgi:hypothetical protein